jgi:hypothetical protein
MEKEDIIWIKCKCINCRREVEIKIFPYGFGTIGLCPLCFSLAYNKRENDVFNS